MSVAASLALLLLLTPAARAHGEGGELFAGAEKILIPFSENPPRIDGDIQAGEYNAYGQWEEAGEDLQILLAHNGSAIFIGVRQPGTGWAGVALSSDLDEGANVVLATVNATGPQVSDGFAAIVSDEMERVPDIVAGGTSDLLAFGATASASETTYEFAIPLASGDPYDQQFEPGAIYPFVVAFNETTQELPTSFIDGDVHFFQAYVARATDNLAAIQDEFRNEPSPMSPIAAMVVLSAGVGTLIWLYAAPRRTAVR